MTDQLYKMILVDDEDEVRGRISSRISAETGFSVVGTAGNGHDALELIEEHAPHVLLTDIKMPYIDGIELASIVRRDYPTVKIGFLTGYNEFDYAREAVNLRVHSYLTKPLTEEAIRAFLTDLKRELDEEYENNYSRQIIQRQYEESIPLLVEQCFTTVLLSRDHSVESEIDQLKTYGVELDGTGYVMAYVAVERNIQHWNMIEFEKLKLQVRTNIEKTLRSEEIGYHTFFFNEGIVLLVTESGVRFRADLDLVLNRIIRSIDRFLSVGVAIGVSRNHRSFRDVRTAYDEAVRAYERGRLQSVGRLVYVDELREAPRRYAVLTESDTERLRHEIHYGTSGSFRAVLDEVRTRLAADRSVIVDHRLLMLGVANVLIQYGTNVGADIHVINADDMIDTISRIKSVDEFIGWAERQVTALHEYGRRNRMDNAERILSTAIAYIEEHYADNALTMQSLAEEQGISVSYLGQLFKKYRDTTFVKYVTSVRIERAKKQLSLSGSRIVEVAEACGYRDVYYFSHCFRKYVGVPPKKYREQQQ
ncbi:MAG: response regulator [Spirochaeta sp.]|jgi:two-component system response regulator YesN|nr:response regulator [Spirochaeta sp.]